MNETGRYEHADVAVLGGGPAGMQAALVISRTRKKVVVFDDPTPPRNGASHGIHNFLGLEGLLPEDLRKIAWKQIHRYGSAELRREEVVDVDRASDGKFTIFGHEGSRLAATKVILAVGYHDVYPDVPGFAECWADTIIPCPFCDGYENRDRAWGIVAGSAEELHRFPKMAYNWTSRIALFLRPDLEIESSYREELSALGVRVHGGAIIEVRHSQGKVEGVVLDSGERVDVGTLLWVPEARNSPLIEVLATKLGMQLDESGHPKTDETQHTSVNGLWAVGDVQGWAGGLEAAAAGTRAAFSIVRGWFG